MIRSLRHTFVFSTLLAAGVGACGAPSEEIEAYTSRAEELTGVTGTVSLTSEWGTGYCANVEVLNPTTTTTTDWQVILDLHQSVVSGGAWNASATTSGTQLTAKALSWNAAIPAKGKASFGFCANRTGTNYRPTIVSVSSWPTGGSTSTGTTTSTTTSISSTTTSTTSTTTSTTSTTTSTSSTPLLPGACEVGTDVQSVSKQPLGISPVYLNQTTSSFVVQLTVKANSAIPANTRLSFDLPLVQGRRLAVENVAPVASGTGVTRVSPTANSYAVVLPKALANGQTATLALTVVGSGSPGVHGPRNFRLQSGTSSSDCSVRPRFERLSFVGQHNDLLTPSLSDLPDILRRGEGNPTANVEHFGTVHHKAKSDYSYRIAFAARTGAKLADCNVPWTSALPQTLCQRGAGWIRENYLKIYEDHLALGRDLQSLIDKNRSTDAAAPNRVYIQLEADNHQYRLWQMDSFVPAYVNSLGNYSLTATTGYAPDTSCSSAIMKRQGQAAILLSKKLNATDFLNSFARRLDHPEDVAKPFFEYSYDTATQRCVWNAATRTRVAADKATNPFTGASEIVNTALTVAESGVLMGQMAKAIKTHCHSCVIAFSAPSWAGQVPELLATIDQDPVASESVEFVYRYAISTPGGTATIPIGAGFADFVAATNRPTILAAPLRVPRGWTPSATSSNAWLSRPVLQALWDAGVQAISVDPEGAPCATDPTKTCYAAADYQALSNFMQEFAVRRPLR